MGDAALYAGGAALRRGLDPLMVTTLSRGDYELVRWWLDEADRQDDERGEEQAARQAAAVVLFLQSATARPDA